LRRDRRKRPRRVTASAVRRGPTWCRRTAPGSGARVWAPHAGHARATARCAVTCARTGGSSTTWWRAGVPTAAPAASAGPPRRHAAGRCSTTASTRVGGRTARWWPRCPGCPPRARPRAAAARTTPGGSVAGGREELVESCATRASTSRMRASSATITTRTAGLRTSPAASSCSTALMHRRPPQHAGHPATTLNDYDISARLWPFHTVRRRSLGRASSASRRRPRASRRPRRARLARRVGRAARRVGGRASGSGRTSRARTRPPAPCRSP